MPLNAGLIFRLVLGLPAVYLASGFPLARLLLREEKTFSLKLFLTSFACSLFLTYPAAVLTTILEGQSVAAIYSVHLPHSLFSLFLVSLSFWILMLRQKLPSLRFPKLQKFHVVITFFVILYSVFVFWNLGRADNLGDDYDLGYQAYNLHDGILAARKAFILSFNTHPPLPLTIKHFSLQLSSPWGLETLSDWMFRGVEGFLGLGTILFLYLLVRDMAGIKAGIIAVAIAAVNNYLVFGGRLFEREIYLTFFVTATLYYLFHYLKSESRTNLFLVSLFFGCSLLVKASGIILLPAILLVVLLRHRRDFFIFSLTSLAIYCPVILYNLAAFLTVGKMDATFSLLFGLPHPFLTGSPANPWLVNPPTIFFMLSDLFSSPVFLFFLLSLALMICNFQKYRKESSILLITLASALLFFSLSPIRGYYHMPMTVLLIAVTAILCARNRLLLAVLPVVLLFSAVYTARSNLVSQPAGLVAGDVGADGNFLPLAKRFFSADFSIITAVYTPQRGWKDLPEKVAQVYKPGSCLIKANGVNDLALRRYLQTDDGVKKAFLGPNYPHFYKMCDEVDGPVQRIQIFYNSEGLVQYQIL